ncbi:Six-hairpin glycosidase-like protein [Aspergillus karnatakaensis]|uniref:Six-hairpin glycosidase-like protein n=1 Tax=Aspergillus karnatakaensis TaxID=1810916 RepID=UPI003CCD4583
MVFLHSAKALLLAFAVEAVASGVIVHPEYYEHSGNNFYRYDGDSACLNLSSANPLLTLDYGTETSGHPFFEVQSLSGPVQIEAKYSEAKAGLDHPFGDGPWTFANGLSNTFRVETFNITAAGEIESFFQQAGFRWQSLRLLNNNSTVEVCSVGIRSSTDRTPLDDLPGYFESSDPLYNEIWALGARCAQETCIEKGTASSTWEVTPDGALLRGQQSAQSVFGATYSNYTITFETKIVRGGTGWRIATSPKGFGLSLFLTSEYPSESTFLNTNRTLLPPNTLIAGYGWNLVNQTSLDTGKPSYYPLQFDVKEGEWIRIATRITPEGYVVSIDNHRPVTVALSELQLMVSPRFSTGSVYTGTWGFGPYQDQTAYVKDVLVRAQNGTVTYSNPMTDPSILEEYAVQTNDRSLCVEGAKRDRLIWSGDFVHTQRIMSLSTYQNEYIKGTLEFLLDRQESSGHSAGLFAMSPAMGGSPKYAAIYKDYGLLDYQMQFLNTFARFYLQSGDNEFIKRAWKQLKTGLEVMMPLVDQDSGLATAGLGGMFFIGDPKGTAASSLLAHTFTQMAGLAEVVGEPATASYWNAIAANLTSAVNRHLWSNDLGTYSSSLTAINESSLPGTAFAILSGAANKSQTASAIAALSSLRLGIGYKTTTDTPSSDPSTNLSPNLSGFLLEAIFIHARRTPSDTATSEAIDTLINGLWAAMVTQDEYYTGTSWEYVYPDGRPGLDLFTSHAHPWGGAPTYVFTEYLLGIQPTKPGYREWEFWPTLTHTGLSWVKGRVPTPHGGIEASWSIGRNSTEVELEVCGPEGTRGAVRLSLAASKCWLNGEVVREGCGEEGLQLKISGGSCSTVTVSLIEPL